MLICVEESAMTPSCSVISVGLPNEIKEELLKLRSEPMNADLRKMKIKERKNAMEEMIK